MCPPTPTPRFLRVGINTLVLLFVSRSYRLKPARQTAPVAEILGALRTPSRGRGGGGNALGNLARPVAAVSVKAHVSHRASPVRAGVYRGRGRRARKNHGRFLFFEPAHGVGTGVVPLTPEAVHLGLKVRRLLRGNARSVFVAGLCASIGGREGGE